MRILIFILVVLGGLGCGLLGFLGKSALKREQSEPFAQLALKIAAELDQMSDDEIAKQTGNDPKLVRAALAALKSRSLLIYALLAAFPLGLVGGFLALYGKRWFALAALVVVGVVPIVFAYQLQSFYQSAPSGVKTGDTEAGFIVAATPPGLLVLSGLLCAFIMPVKKTSSVKEDEEESDEDVPAPKPVAAKRKRDSVDIQTADEGITVRKPARAPVLLLKCPTCGKALKKTDPQAGKPIKCPGCANTFPIPEKGVELARAAHEKAKAEYEAALAAQQEQAESFEEEEDEPPSRGRKRR